MSISRSSSASKKWDDFFLGPNLVSFNRTLVPYEISKVNFRKKILDLLYLYTSIVQNFEKNSQYWSKFLY